MPVCLYVLVYVNQFPCLCFYIYICLYVCVSILSVCLSVRVFVNVCQPEVFDTSLDKYSRTAL